MRELREALADLNAIRVQVARGTQFRGYGPNSIAASGLLAIAVATAQSFSSGAEHSVATFLTWWISTAAIAVTASAWETFSRTRRFHRGFSREMIHAASEQLLPPLLVGLLLTVVLIRAAPDEVWMLPGLWEIAFSLGIFASVRFLPRPMFAAGLWYLICGLTCLSIESGPRTLSPWGMGLPFGVGQLLVAAVLKYSYAGDSYLGVSGGHQYPAQRVASGDAGEPELANRSECERPGPSRRRP